MYKVKILEYTSSKYLFYHFLINVNWFIPKNTVLNIFYSTTLKVNEKKNMAVV